MIFFKLLDFACVCVSSDERGWTRLISGEENAGRDKAAKIGDPGAVGELEGRPARPGGPFSTHS